MFIFSSSSSPFRAQASYSVPKSFFTDGRTPWTGDQPVARPLPKHRTTLTRNKGIHIPNIHALSGIRTHDPSVRASEDSSCIRPRGHCDRDLLMYLFRKMAVTLIIITKEYHIHEVYANVDGILFFKFNSSLTHSWS
jgi:hypothetical protein